MGRRTEKEDDEWYGVHDPRERKKIQDRLAQRARRQRLAEKDPKQNTKNTNATLVIVQKPKANTSQTLQKRQPKAKQIGPPTPPTKPPSSSESLSEAPFPPYLGFGPLMKISRTSQAQMGIYQAMFTNGLILSLPCSTSTISVSNPPTACTPPSLTPTEIQLTTVHFQWIDRFPMPKLRDRMITLSDYFSAEDFLGDLFTVDTFSLREGGIGWEEKDWIVEPGFKEKWWFLFV